MVGCVIAKISRFRKESDEIMERLSVEPMLLALAAVYTSSVTLL